EGRGARDRGPPDCAPAPLPADATRGRLLAGDDDPLSSADRADQAVPRARLQLSGELRRDPLSARLVVIAPARGRRPGAARGTIAPPTQEELEECPFCAGHEERTPPETLRLPQDGDWPALGCPPGSRLPYELMIAPLDEEADGFRSELLASALHLLAEAIRRLRRLEGAVPWNAWLHNGRRWHIEVVPRLAILAGLELGA